jgi:hypothetical protein
MYSSLYFAIWYRGVLSVFERPAPVGTADVVVLPKVPMFSGARTGEQTRCQKAFGMEIAKLKNFASSLRTRRVPSTALARGAKRSIIPPMEQVKDTLRATVRITYDGKVHKTFRGPKAEERFATEVRVLQFLEKQGCPFVPRLLESYPQELRIVTTNCGTRVEHIDDARAREVFAELEPYGVRHDDAEARNITYRRSDGRFCVIDFEFATILPGFE